MSLVDGWLPPPYEGWTFTSYLLGWFPVVTLFQWVMPWYGMGKTSTVSIFNLPGKFAWLTMESTGLVTLLYIMFTLPGKLGIESLPWENWCMAAIYTTHYIYRGPLSTAMTPSISPMHVIIWLSGICFQVANATCIGGWLAGYGPSTREDWGSYQGNYQASLRVGAGLVVWAVGFLLTVYHDDVLREIRRAARRRAAENEELARRRGPGNGSVSVDKIYVIPQNGMFKWVLYPHYLFEWLEWTGFWIIGGATFLPGRCFVVNEIATMLPRALQGKRWYVARFGKEKVGARKAIIPGVI